MGLSGKDGKPGRDGIDGIAGNSGRDGAPGLNGKDGVDGKDGRDGLAGLHGRDGAPGIDGKHGLDGIDGRDGLGFDDLVMEYDGEREVVFRMVRGEQVKEFRFKLPIPIDRGTYKDGEAYERGDVVSFGGSFWLAQCDTAAKPETSPDWRLGVKRGRDGKDGKAGAKGERGLPGKDGKWP
jgi:integrin beta 3